MGNRANVKVISASSTVFLYTHWTGDELPQVLQSALRRGKDRWDDNQYLTRIIFCEMVQGVEMELTGFGISSIIGDGDDRVLTVNIDKQTVSYGQEFPSEKIFKSISLSDYTDAAYIPKWISA